MLETAAISFGSCLSHSYEDICPVSLDKNTIGSFGFDLLPQLEHQLNHKMFNDRDFHITNFMVGIHVSTLCDFLFFNSKVDL